MRLAYTDILMSRMWAEEHKGEDDAMDVFEQKLLSFALKQHQDGMAYHEKQIEKIKAEMEIIEARFKISGEEF